MNKETVSSKKELRIFGIVLGLILILTGPVRLWIHEGALYMNLPASILGVLGVVFLITGLLAHSVLRYPYIPFSRLGRLVAVINTNLLLILSYLLLIVPVGMFMRILGKDPMRKRWDPEAETYWIPREKEKQKSMISERQF